MNATKESQHPADNQQEFLEKYVLNQPGMVFTIKMSTRQGWTSCNLRGPFRLSRPYEFPKKIETVLEPEWSVYGAGEQESNVHVHIPWQHVASVRLSNTSNEVRENIHHDYQLTFFDGDGQKLFWFYIKDDQHPAVRDKALREMVSFGPSRTPVLPRC
jgi:hypothetical protein